MRALWQSICDIGKLFGPHRRLWLPFLTTAFLEAVLIGLIWLAPHPPFSNVLAPPIRFFFSDRDLHYPIHLWFMYYAMKHTNIIASIALGAFMTGMACVMVQQAHTGVRISLRAALHSRQVRYGRVTLIWIVMWVVAKEGIEAFIRVAPKTLPVMWIAVALSMVIQALLVYAIPVAIFEGLSWWRALLRGVRETIAYPLSTLIVVAFSSAAVLAFSLLFPPIRIRVWMQQLPELVLVFIVAKWVIWTIADTVMTVGIAHLWWAHRIEQTMDVREASSAPLTTGKLSQGSVIA